MPRHHGRHDLAVSPQRRDTAGGIAQQSFFEVPWCRRPVDPQGADEAPPDISEGAPQSRACGATLRPPGARGGIHMAGTRALANSLSNRSTLARDPHTAGGAREAPAPAGTRDCLEHSLVLNTRCVPCLMLCPSASPPQSIRKSSRRIGTILIWMMSSDITQSDFADPLYINTAFTGAVANFVDSFGSVSLERSFGLGAFLMLRLSRKAMSIVLTIITTVCLCPYTATLVDISPCCC